MPLNRFYFIEKTKQFLPLKFLFKPSNWLHTSFPLHIKLIQQQITNLTINAQNGKKGTSSGFINIVSTQRDHKKNFYPRWSQIRPKTLSHALSIYSDSLLEKSKSILLPSHSLPNSLDSKHDFIDNLFPSTLSCNIIKLCFMCSLRSQIEKSFENLSRAVLLVYNSIFILRTSKSI